MSCWIWVRCGALLIFFVSIAVPQAARAVFPLNPTTPSVYAVTFVNEDWTEAVAVGGAFGYLENTEQIDGTDTATSFQQAGIDGAPIGTGCTPPCTGMTAETTATYVDGAVVLSGSSHTYAHFDRFYRTGEEGNYSYHPAYSTGNVVRAESNATVLDRLTITQPVVIDLQGHLSGEIHYDSASPSSEPYELNVYYGDGRASVDLIVQLVPTPLNFTTYYLNVQNLAAHFQSSESFDQELSGTSTTLLPGDYLFKAELRTTTRIGTLSGTTLAVQDMGADFGHTVTFRLAADVPGAVTSASGLLTFAPEPSGDALALVASGGLALVALRRRRRLPSD